MIKSLSLNENIHLRYLGPDPDKGPLPAVFYFALSAEESLTLDPYNQPAIFLSEYPLRIFSMDLPAHGPGLNPVHALRVWAKEYAEGKDPLSPFFSLADKAISELIKQKLVLPEKMGLMGLSRGGFVAMHIAALRSDIHTLVAFAPLTHLSKAKEFADIEMQRLDLTHYLDVLKEQKMRLYLGNRDTRVHTHLCTDFVLSLAETSFASGQRSPPIELILSPSIGHMGHGTSRETFHEGASYLGKRLGVIR